MTTAASRGNSTSPDWQRLSHAPEPDPDSVDLWLVPLQSRGPIEAGDCSATEHEQAGLALRRILSRYTGQEPDALRFARRAGGKPYLAQLAHAPSFNLSHTRGWSLIAVTPVAEVGVDVERARASVDIAAVSRRVFGREASEALCRLPDAERMPGFLRAWTRFEACQKAMGQGIFAAPVEAAAMQVSTIHVAQDTIASVAVVADHPIHLRHFTEHGQ